ncbi:hypothetical protein ERO13_D10G078150v2, partial [Gossypium hirsutum]
SSESLLKCKDPTLDKAANNLTAPRLHQPGIEPGSVPWQGTILPLDHWCLLQVQMVNSVNIKLNTFFQTYY